MRWRVLQDQRRIRAAAPEGGLSRLADSDRILRSFAAAVALELRRQQTSFDLYARSNGLLERTIAKARAEGDDPLGDWKPSTGADGMLPWQRESYEAAGQNALITLGADADARFIVTDPTLQQKVNDLLLDQIKGIDDTTREDLQGILSRGDGKTIAELGQEISDYWDEASTSRGITIASTEMARAAAEAERDTYGRNGLEYVELVGCSLSCEKCAPLQGDRYKLEDAAGILPLHPRCYGYWSPVIPEDWRLGSSPWTGGAVEGEERSRFPVETRAAATRVDGMVAFYLPTDVAKKLAVPGYETPTKLHLTLAYFADVSDIDREALVNVLTGFSRYAGVLEGKISGIGRFIGDAPGSTKDAVYASFDSPRLPEFRQSLIENLERAGFDADPTHGFSPHITLAYVDRGKASPCDTVPALPIRFEEISLVTADARTDFPLTARGRMYETIEIFTRARAPEIKRRPKEHVHDPDEPNAVLTFDFNETLTDGKHYPLLFEPYPKVKKWLDRWAARKACLHIHTAGLFFGGEDLEVYEAREKMLWEWCQRFALPIQWIGPKYPADIYYNDRQVWIPPTPDWDDIGEQAEDRMAERFDIKSGIWIRKDKIRIGKEITEWPDPGPAYMRDYPRGFSGARLDADFHRTVFEASSSLRASPPREYAVEALTELFGIPVTTSLSCAGWNPFTHEPNDWPRRIAMLRYQARSYGVPFDRITTGDHFDLGFDDRGMRARSDAEGGWKADLPELRRRLHVDAMKDHFEERPI